MLDEHLRLDSGRDVDRDPVRGRPRRRTSLLVVLAATLLAFALTTALSFVLSSDAYEGSQLLRVGDSSEAATFTDPASVQRVLTTSADIANHPEVRAEVLETAGVDDAAAGVRLKAEAIRETELIELRASAANASQARHLATVYGDVVSERLDQVFGDRVAVVLVARSVTAPDETPWLNGLYGAAAAALLVGGGLLMLRSRPRPGGA